MPADHQPHAPSRENCRRCGLPLRAENLDQTGEFHASCISRLPDHAPSTNDLGWGTPQYVHPDDTGICTIHNHRRPAQDAPSTTGEPAPLDRVLGAISLTGPAPEADIFDTPDPALPQPLTTDLERQQEATIEQLRLDHQRAERYESGLRSQVDNCQANAHYRAWQETQAQLAQVKQQRDQQVESIRRLQEHEHDLRGDINKLDRELAQAFAQRDLYLAELQHTRAVVQAAREHVESCEYPDGPLDTLDQVLDDLDRAAAAVTVQDNVQSRL